MIDNFSNDIYSANIYFFWIYSQINGKFLPSIHGLNHPAQALSAAPAHRHLHKYTEIAGRFHEYKRKNVSSCQ